MSWAEECEAIAADWQASVHELICADYWISVYQQGHWDYVAEPLGTQIRRFKSPARTDFLSAGWVNDSCNEIVSDLESVSLLVDEAETRLSDWTGTAADACVDYIKQLMSTNRELARIVDALKLSVEAYREVVESMQADLADLLEKGAQAAQDDGPFVPVDIAKTIVDAIGTVVTDGPHELLRDVLKDVVGDAVKSQFDADVEDNLIALTGHLRLLMDEKTAPQAAPIVDALEKISEALDEAKVPAAVDSPPIAVDKAFDPTSFLPEEAEYRRQIDTSKVPKTPLIE